MLLIKKKKIGFLFNIAVDLGFGDLEVYDSIVFVFGIFGRFGSVALIWKYIYIYILLKSLLRKYIYIYCHWIAKELILLWELIFVLHVVAS